MNLYRALAFLLFIGILIYHKVPAKIGELLTAFGSGLDPDEAKALREEAQSLLRRQGERKQKEVCEQANRIGSYHGKEAADAATKAAMEIANSITRRLAAGRVVGDQRKGSRLRPGKDQAVIVAAAASKGYFGGANGCQGCTHRLMMIACAIDVLIGPPSFAGFFMRGGSVTD
jgi:F-type H+-transporting ATPase subunit b